MTLLLTVVLQGFQRISEHLFDSSLDVEALLAQHKQQAVAFLHYEIGR